MFDRTNEHFNSICFDKEMQHLVCFKGILTNKYEKVDVHLENSSHQLLEIKKIQNLNKMTNALSLLLVCLYFVF